MRGLKCGLLKKKKKRLELSVVMTSCYSRCTCHLSAITPLPQAFLYSINNLMGTNWRFVLFFSLLIFFLCKPDETSQLQTTQDMCGHLLFDGFAQEHTLLCQLLPWKLHQFITFVFSTKTVMNIQQLFSCYCLHLANKFMFVLCLL